MKDGQSPKGLVEGAVEKWRGSRAEGGEGGGNLPLLVVKTRTRLAKDEGRRIFMFFGTPFPEPLLEGPRANLCSSLSIKSIYAYAHAADPVNSLRRNSLRHQTLETPLCRFYKVPIPWTQRHPRDPTPTPTPQPSAPFGVRGPRGPLGLFRSHSEWKVISSGR